MVGAARGRGECVALPKKMFSKMTEQYGVVGSIYTNRLKLARNAHVRLATAYWAGRQAFAVERDRACT